MAAAIKVDSNPKILPDSASKSSSVASKPKIQTTVTQNLQVSVSLDYTKIDYQKSPTLVDKQLLLTSTVISDFRV